MSGHVSPGHIPRVVADTQAAAESPYHTHDTRPSTTGAATGLGAPEREEVREGRDAGSGVAARLLRSPISAAAGDSTGQPDGGEDVAGAEPRQLFDI
ncbi:hypothetical protein PG997_010957 [Apiospora hydei]|uniref:Uncharacterized protein n=1 Tax=Apiospora hydei TaxID=1337664 RepID=A0ABR1VHP1_9PEZI